MQNNISYDCPACNFKSEIAFETNKHIQNCESYKLWIKHYNPPKSLKCENCKTEFLEKYFINHVKNCKINLF